MRNMIRALFRMIEKDLKLLMRDPKTFILVFLTPVFIMAILGNVFNETGDDEAIQAFQLGICDMDKSPLLNFSSGAFHPLALGAGCNLDSSTLVKEGKLRGLIVIPPNFTSNIQGGYGSTLILYLDNSKSIAAATITAVMRAFVQETSEELGSAFISQAWENIRSLNEKLKVVTRELVVVRTTAEQLKLQVEDITTSLESINFTQVYEDIDATQSTVDEQLRTHERGLGLLQEEVIRLEQNVSALNLSIDGQLGVLEARAREYCSLNISFNASTTVFNQSCARLMNNSSMNGSCSLYYEVSYDTCATFQGSLDEMKNITQSFVFLRQDIRKSLREINHSLWLLENDTRMLRNQSNRTFEMQLLRMEKERLRALGQLENTSLTVTDFLAKLITFQEDLNQTTLVLDRYTAIEPRNVVRPVSLEEHRVFPDIKKITFMTPGLMGVIMMFILMLLASSSVVQERNSGTMIRTFLAPVHLAVFIFQKVIVSMLLAIVQAACLLGVALALGVSVPASIEMVLVIVVMSFVLVSIGILIGSISSNENTSLLTSMVFGIPMLFLSGVFFPFEIMPAYMRTIAWDLPLSAAIRNLDAALVYRVSVNYQELGMLVVIGLVLLAGATYFVRKSLEK